MYKYNYAVILLLVCCFLEAKSQPPLTLLNNCGGNQTANYVSQTKNWGAISCARENETTVYLYKNNSFELSKNITYEINKMVLREINGQIWLLISSVNGIILYNYGDGDTYFQSYRNLSITDYNGKIDMQGDWIIYSKDNNVTAYRYKTEKTQSIASYNKDVVSISIDFTFGKYQAIILLQNSSIAKIYALNSDEIWIEYKDILLLNGCGKESVLQRDTALIRTYTNMNCTGSILVQLYERSTNGNWTDITSFHANPVTYEMLTTTTTTTTIALEGIRIAIGNGSSIATYTMDYTGNWIPEYIIPKVDIFSLSIDGILIGYINGFYYSSLTSSDHLTLTSPMEVIDENIRFNGNLVIEQDNNITFVNSNCTINGNIVIEGTIYLEGYSFMNFFGNMTCASTGLLILGHTFKGGVNVTSCTELGGGLIVDKSLLDKSNKVTLLTSQCSYGNFTYIEVPGENCIISEVNYYTVSVVLTITDCSQGIPYWAWIILAVLLFCFIVVMILSCIYVKRLHQIREKFLDQFSVKT